MHIYHPRFALLDTDACEQFHQASLEILRRTGIRVYHPEALALLKQAGAMISDDNLVRLPTALVEWALGKAPSRVVLCTRGTDEAAVVLADHRVNFGSGSDTLHYLDPKTGRRDFTAEDVAACVRLCDALPQIGFVMSMGIPTDVPTEEQYRRQYALMLANTTKPTVFVADGRADCEAIVSAAAAVAGGMEQLQLHPTLLLYSEPTSPLVHSRTATEKLLYMAEQRMPIVHSPAPMMGGTAPVTLAGGMALSNAEILSSLVLHQLQQEGAPFIYGSGLHHLDMRSTISVYGAPEFQLARAMIAEMGRYYRLPTWGYAGCSDSPIVDGQAIADAAYQVRDALLMGVNLVHDVGYMEGGLATSPEMIVLSAEVIEMHRHFMQGVQIDPASLALEVIHHVGPGNNFLSEDHTLEHFRNYWYPTLFERRRHDEWLAASGKKFEERLRVKTIAMMEEHKPEPLPDNVWAEDVIKL